MVGVHGVRVAGHFLPGSMTYLHGVLQVRGPVYVLPQSCTLGTEAV